jgi:glycosyltransferase involved in cell wall biosynthesis
MRIGIIAPVWFPVPPAGYGGIELVVALLADGLVDAGEDVTLFASEGSLTKAKLVAPPHTPPPAHLLGNPWYDAYHAVLAYEHAGDFDVIHDHAAVAGPSIGALFRGAPPVVHTLHGPWTEQTRLFYDVAAPHLHLVAISEAQRRDNQDVQYAGTVYNGVDLDAYPFRAEKEDFLVYIGRANPEKGPATAITVARHAGKPIKLVLKRNEPPEMAYYEEMVVPLLGDDVEIFENITHAEKVDLLGRAQAMLFPIHWPEPFGLVMVEAMACGTPVVTTNWGAAPELVEEGVTGFRRDGYGEMIDALNWVTEISPAACRARVEERFSAIAMVENYRRVYEQVTGR